jgi:hypothetical protein
MSFSHSLGYSDKGKVNEKGVESEKEWQSQMTDK